MAGPPTRFSRSPNTATPEGASRRGCRRRRRRRRVQPGDGARRIRGHRLRGARWTCRRARGGGSAPTTGSRCRPPALPAGRRSRCLRFHRAAPAVPVPGRVAVAGCRILPAGCEVAVQSGLQRAGDDVLGVRVRADVRRYRVDRLLVAVVRVEAVDAPVVEPVAKHLLATWCRRARGRRYGQRRRRRQRDDDQRDERAALTTGCHV